MEPTFWLYAIGSICGVLGVGGSALAFWSNLTTRMTTNKITAEAALNNSASAIIRIDQLANEMADAREASARNLGKLEASHDALSRAWEVTERRLADAVEEMTGSVRHLSDRLDRLIEHMVGKEAAE